MMATLVGLFGAIALLLAVLGLYGVMAHAAIPADDRKSAFAWRWGPSRQQLSA